MAERPTAVGLEISDREFRLFQDLILREAGIHLSTWKRSLLVGRLARRIRSLGLASFAAYYQRVIDDPAGEMVEMLDRVCTNETHFFREPQHFEILEREVFPKWEARTRDGGEPKMLRVWSAGCSTGEEPYSLAMSLIRRFPPSSGWGVRILATDLSTRALQAAQEGVFSLKKASEIPDDLLKRFMLRGVGSQTGRMKAGPEIRALVDFARLNLSAPPFPVVGRFHAIFCRNVLIYFRQEEKVRVLNHLISHLAEGGYLFLGHSEALHGVSEGVRPVVPTVYVRDARQRQSGA